MDEYPLIFFIKDNLKKRNESPSNFEGGSNIFEKHRILRSRIEI